MQVKNDIITEATLQSQSFIGNRVALDASNRSSNNGSTSYWYDVSGNFNRATLNSVGVNNNSYSFTPAIDASNSNFASATTSYATIVDSKSVDIPGYELTIEIWFKVTSMYGYNQNANPTSWPLKNSTGQGINLNTQGLLWKQADPTYRAFNYGLQITDGNITFTHYSGGDFRFHDAQFNCIGNFPGNWVQLVYKQNNGIWSITTNGDNILSSGSDVYILETNNEPVYVGRRGDITRTENTPVAFYGEIGVVNIWDRHLSDSEVKSNYNYYRTIYN